jgi:hypothetical protein
MSSLRNKRDAHVGQLFRAKGRRIRAGQMNGAFGCFDTTRDGGQRCGLTGAIRTDNAHDLIHVDLKGNTPQSDHSIVMDMEIINCEQGRQLFLHPEISIDDGLMALDLFRHTLG